MLHSCDDGSSIAVLNADQASASASFLELVSNLMLHESLPLGQDDLPFIRHIHEQAYSK